jgi:membrane-associated phospholipid phosphatase
VYALQSIAAYGAAMAVGPGTSDPVGGRAQYEGRRAAIAAASANLLSTLFPLDATEIQNQLAAFVAANGKAHPQFSRGLEVGHAAGERMKAWAASDGFAVPWNESMRNAPGTGIWTGVIAVPPAAPVPPAGFQFPKIVPYYLQAMNGNAAQRQFRPPPPPAFSMVAGSPFKIGLDEVKTIFLTRTQAQIDIANFWNTAGGFWNERAEQYGIESGYDELAASHLLALMNSAVMDAVIGCWEAKYHYLLLRPAQADPTILTVFTVPNHPTYPSGHSCVSGAASTVLADHFPAHATELAAWMSEAGWSRIYAGIHFQFDVLAGQTLGRSTGAWAIDYDRAHGLLTAVGMQ